MQVLEIQSEPEVQCSPGKPGSLFLSGTYSQTASVWALGRILQYFPRLPSQIWNS